MSGDLVELLEALRGSRRPYLLRTVQRAALDAEPPDPEPELSSPTVGSLRASATA
jgi:hypothetical protein